MQNPLFNKSFLAKKVAEYKTETKDNSAIFLKWHNDNQKEEALQTNFLNDIFGKALDYEIDTGKAEFNLLTEYKTQKDGTKVDGVLGFITRDKKDIRVAIELKAKNTTNLDSVEKQAFEYRDKIDGIEWVITSNTNEIRLYSAKSGGRLKYQSWTMSELANNHAKQKEFHFLLAKDRLFSAEKSTSPTHKLLEDNTKEEELIEKRFYNDYKDLRKKLFSHLREQNQTKEPTTLLSKTQKLLDRIIFVCFCEDLNLLPDKIFTKLLKTTQESFVETTVWQQIKGLFNAIDKGYPQKNINKFNGGLFAKDIELDDLILQDAILKEIITISDWDFGSELTVNILGHIFEQSITDLEEIKADISGETHDKKQGKRKKDGVFYTPEYITRYIVEEAVGGWLNDRKIELGIEKLIELTEDDFIKKGKKPSKNAQKHIDFWNSYAKILQNIKVLDPACGSGAFLVAVFNFLENEWLTLSETLRRLGDDEQAGLFSYSQVYKNILKNNIYGVDLNPESVQITKLSLWLKTANRSEELTTLDANIKCGNSLIDDSTVCPKAFKWEAEFPFKFDVVVGNPPYGAGLSEIEQSYMKKTYDCGSTDTAAIFTYKANFLTKEKANISFIIPKSYCYASNYGQLREINRNQIHKLVDCGKVWNEVLLEQVVICLAKNKTDEFTSLKRSGEAFQEIGKFNQNDCDLFGFFINGISEKELNLAKKIKANCVSLNDVARNSRGMIMLQSDFKQRGAWEVIGGNEIDRFGVKSIKGVIDTKNIHSNAYIKDNSVLVQGVVAHIQNPIDHIKITACIPNETHYVLYDSINNLLINEGCSKYYVWLLLNHKLVNWYAYRFIYGKAIRTMRFDNPTTSRIPIPQIPLAEQTPFVEKAQTMLAHISLFNEKRTAFIDYFRGKFALQKITRNLENWHTLEFADFIKELGKQKVLLSSTDEYDFKPLFDREKKACVELQAKISQTDAEIDKMVYSLYGLSEEEIGVVEGLVV